MGETIRVRASEIQQGLSYPGKVLYAGESSRRMAFIEHAFDKSIVENFAVGPEPQAPPEAVMRFKLEAGLARVPKDYLGAIIAADTQTVIPEVRDGIPNLVSRGKPADPQELHNSLEGMLNVSNLTGEPPFYQVDSSSGLLHMNSKRVQVEDAESCLVVLKRPQMAALITEEGFQRYLAEFARFYSQPPYSTHHMKPITPADLSGGLSLPVLLKLGAVQSVAGVDEMDERFREILKHNIHLVAVGITPAILKSVQVDTKKIYEWDWLSEVVDHALS